MGTTEILARHVVETTYESLETLPADVVRAAKDVILDGVGVTMIESRPALRDLIAVLDGGRRGRAPR